jgi:hypothetical protein
MKNINILIAAMITSSLFLVAAIPIQAADVTITDSTGDVSTIDIYGEQSSIVTSNPNINIDNIDITKLTYTRTGATATLTFEVKGTIENRGSILDANQNYPENLTEINDVEYEMTLGTNLAGSPGETYTVVYVNKQCQLTTSTDDTPVNLTSSQFFTSGNVLTIIIPLKNTDEIYATLNANSTFLKLNLSALNENITNPDELSNLYTFLADVAPNPALAVSIIYAPNVGSAGESLQFNSSVTPLTGQPPYSFEWKFGDGTTSSEQNPTHIYTKAGTFTYNLTVSDQANAKAYQSDTIKITGEGDGNGITSSPLLLFLAVIIIIAAIGIVVLVVIIRRR